MVALWPAGSEMAAVAGYPATLTSGALACSRSFRKDLDSEEASCGCESRKVKGSVRQRVAASGSGRHPLDRSVTLRRLPHPQRPATPCLQRRTIAQDGNYTRRDGPIHQKERKISSNDDPPEVRVARASC